MWERYLDSLAVFGMRPGLERVVALLDALGRPQERYRVVHVVGTNGKSSTTRYTASILAAQGLCAGAYLSPHIRGYTERVLVGGRPVAADLFGAAVDRVRDEAGRLPDGLGETTQFEVLTAAALLAFAESGVEAVALEAGLGGRLDATNVVEAPVVVVTNIGLEHTEVLGDTREAIFAEKAAVIKGGDALFGPLDGLEEAAEGVCARARARAHLLGRDVFVDGGPADFSVRTPHAAYADLRVSSPAAYQVLNAGLAVAAADLLLGRLDAATVREALLHTAVPGRLQVLDRDPLVLADGAHNPDGVRALAATLAGLDVPQPRVGVLAIMRDKDYPGMLATLIPLLDAVVCTRAAEPRSLPVEQLAAAAHAAAVASHRDPVIIAVADPHEAVRHARERAGTTGSVLVTGSLYLLEDLADLLA